MAPFVGRRHRGHGAHARRRQALMDRKRSGARPADVRGRGARAHGEPARGRGESGVVPGNARGAPPAVHRNRRRRVAPPLRHDQRRAVGVRGRAQSRPRAGGHARRGSAQRGAAADRGRAQPALRAGADAGGGLDQGGQLRPGRDARLPGRAPARRLWRALRRPARRGKWPLCRARPGLERGDRGQRRARAVGDRADADRQRADAPDPEGRARAPRRRSLGAVAQDLAYDSGCCCRSARPPRLRRGASPPTAGQYYDFDLFRHGHGAGLGREETHRSAIRFSTPKPPSSNPPPATRSSASARCA